MPSKWRTAVDSMRNETIDRLTKEYETKVLVKQDVDSYLLGLRRVFRSVLPERVYQNLPDGHPEEMELRDLEQSAREFVDQLGTVSNHLYDEVRDLGDELEAQRQLEYERRKQ